MGFRFRKSLGLGSGVRLNLGQKGVSGISAGTKGARISLGRGGKVTKSVGIPGTGISHVSQKKGCLGCLLPVGVAALAIIALTAIALAHPGSQSTASATVLEVVDGDTIHVAYPDGTAATVRYIGIDTPELHHPSVGVECYGAEAATKNSELVSGQQVTLVSDVSDVDRFGRQLRYVYVGDLFVNAELVRQGFAVAATFPPDVAHSAEFAALQGEAQAANVGLWAECGGPDVQIAPPPAPAPAAPVPQPAPPAGYSGPYDPNGPDRDCGDFKTHAEAQAFFIAAGGPASDRHRLDADHDGIACETLP